MGRFFHFLFIVSSFFYTTEVFSSADTLAIDGNRFSESRFHSLLPAPKNRLPESWSYLDSEAPVVLYVGKGTWDTGVEHLKQFLVEHKMGYRTSVGENIQKGLLREPGVRLLVMPGGESWQYLAELGKSGAEEIKDFIKRGGGYAGICAGAFYATSHRLGGYATGPYGIGLLSGTAYDGTALETKPFVEGMMNILIAPSAFMAGFKSLYRIVMFGGPSFRFTAEEENLKKIQVLAQFPDLFEPAMILFQYGNGRVFLSGPHLEIEEDRTQWGKEFEDPDSEWPILHRVVNFLME